MNGYGHLRTSTGMGELQIKDAALAVPPCQGGCREFESRLPLQLLDRKWPLVFLQGPLFLWNDTSFDTN